MAALIDRDLHASASLSSGAKSGRSSRRSPLCWSFNAFSGRPANRSRKDDLSVSNEPGPLTTTARPSAANRQCPLLIELRARPDRRRPKTHTPPGPHQRMTWQRHPPLGIGHQHVVVALPLLIVHRWRQGNRKELIERRIGRRVGGQHDDQVLMLVERIPGRSPLATWLPPAGRGERFAGNKPCRPPAAVSARTAASRTFSTAPWGATPAATPKAASWCSRSPAVPSCTP